MGTWMSDATKNTAVTTDTFGTSSIRIFLTDNAEIPIAIAYPPIETGVDRIPSEMCMVTPYLLCEGFLHVDPEQTTNLYRIRFPIVLHLTMLG